MNKCERSKMESEMIKTQRNKIILNIIYDNLENCLIIIRVKSDWGRRQTEHKNYTCKNFCKIYFSIFTLLSRGKTSTLWSWDW